MIPLLEWRCTFGLSGGRPVANSVPARRKRYALVIVIVPPRWKVHHQKQTLYPAYLLLAETICPFVTNFTTKNAEGQKLNFWPC
jgi:hypothetical protein